MQRITSNSLLVGIILVLASYILISLIIPSPVFSIGVSIFLMLSAALVCRRYLPTTWDIVFYKLRNSADNSHLVVFGISLLAMAAIYQALYGIAWEYYQRPVSWVGTWYSRFGHLMSISGFLCLAFSPDFSAKPPTLKNAVIVSILFLIAISAAFIAGTKSQSFVDDDTMRFLRLNSDSPACPSDKPFWVSSHGRIHGPMSPWRFSVKPRQCFRTEAEAQAAGFRSAD